MAQQIRGHFAITEDPVYNLTLLPISLSVLFAVENVIAQLPPPDTTISDFSHHICLLPCLLVMVESCLSGTINQNNFFHL